MPQPTSNESPRRSQGLLLANGDSGSGRALQGGFAAEGFTVWLAADGQEAVELYCRHSRTIDAVLLDLRLPKLNGPETLAVLQEHHRGVRCGFMSSDLGANTVKGLRALGARVVLMKPFHLPYVARMIAAWRDERNS